MCKWVNDSQRLILEHFDVIHNSPSKIYQHAVAFSPSSSWLYKCYNPELFHGVKVVNGLQARWGSCFRTTSFNHVPRTLACWENLIAVGLWSGDIIILDVVTGIRRSALSRHTVKINALTFSLDGKSLVSGSDDNTINLWDIQTGGVIMTFSGHKSWVKAISISPDCTRIASGSDDHTICLWDAQTGECCHIIDGHKSSVNSVSFSPRNPQFLISASDDHTIRQWNTINGHQIGPTYDGDNVVLSPDGTHFVSWREATATVQNFDSSVVVTKLQASRHHFQYCCFSPNGKLVAGSVGPMIYIWDITGSDFPLIETLVGHTDNITTHSFSSTLISSSFDKSIKFWQISASLTDPAGTDSESTPIASARITSMCLQASDGVAVSVSEAGLVKTWDLSTGLCKESFQTSAGPQSQRDIQLIDGRLIFVWCTHKKIHIWGPKKKNRQMVDAISHFSTTRLRISGDGSKVFILDHKYIQALSIWTGEVVGTVRLEHKPSNDPLVVDGSRVWVHFEDSQTQGWDFGIPGSAPFLLSNAPQNPDRPHLDFIDNTKSGSTSPSRIEDTVTGKEVFQLAGRYAKPTIVQWDGRYLVAGYKSGEVLILDFIHMIPK